MMTGISAVLGSALIWRSTSTPSTRGILMSSSSRTGWAGVAAGVGALAPEEVEGLLAVLEPLEAVGQAGPFQVALDQAGVAVVVLGEHDQERLGAHGLRSPRGSGLAGGGSPACGGGRRRSRAVAGRGKATKNVVPTPARRLQPDPAAVPLDHPAHQGQADPLPLGDVRRGVG